MNLNVVKNKMHPAQHRFARLGGVHNNYLGHYVMIFLQKSFIRKTKYIHATPLQTSCRGNFWLKNAFLNLACDDRI